MTLVTGSQALTVRAGSHEISIPASTRVTIQNNGGLRVSTNDSSANGFVAISSGGSRMGNIAKGEAYPQGEPPLEPISTISALKKPLFCVGVGEMNLSGSSDDSVALLSGERFFCPSRSVKIGTPLGVVVAAYCFSRLGRSGESSSIQLPHWLCEISLAEQIPKNIERGRVLHFRSSADERGDSTSRWNRSKENYVARSR